MGKKKDKKGKGAEKTAQKTDKKADRKLKKELQKKGEDDIEKLIADFQEQDRRKTEVIEEKCEPPSQRCNMSLSAHPTKDELIMFGGEFFNGKQTFLYSDLFFYNIKTNEWTRVTSPNGPPPRCAHQAVVLPQDGGQLWIFGGEFASPTQSQFYHYKDLWVLNLKDKGWHKINAPGGPTSRSGHRMVACKKLLLVFGGFHDNVRDYKYYNDIHAFSLESYTWIKLEVSGAPPAPRSGCMMAAAQDQNSVIIYGGYSKEKVKKDADLGKTHTDMFKLSVDSRCKQEAAPMKWKWMPLKSSKARPSQRCGCTLVAASGNRGIAFGGVYDEEENEEEMTGMFYNDLYTLELDTGKWFDVSIRSKKDVKRKRRKKKEKTTDGATCREDEELSDSEQEEDMEEDLEQLNMDGNEEEAETPSEEKDSVFTVSIGPQGSSVMASGGQDVTAEDDTFTPVPRMNTLMAVKHGLLYLYGGMYEDGDKQYTLSDMYSLDLHKLQEWTTIIPCNLDVVKWEESDESSGEDEEGEEEDQKDMDGAVGGKEEEDMEDEEEDSEEEGEEEEEDMEEGIPAVNSGESLEDYFSRCEVFWVDRASEVAEKEGFKVTAKQTKKAASKMAKEFYQQEVS